MGCEDLSRIGGWPSDVGVGEEGEVAGYGVGGGVEDGEGEVQSGVPRIGEGLRPEPQPPGRRVAGVRLHNVPALGDEGEGAEGVRREEVGVGTLGVYPCVRNVGGVRSEGETAEVEEGDPAVEEPEPLPGPGEGDVQRPRIHVHVLLRWGTVAEQDLIQEGIGELNPQVEGYVGAVREAGGGDPVEEGEGVGGRKGGRPDRVCYGDP